MSRHFFTGCGTGSADLGAGDYLVIAFNRFTGLRARLANDGTCAAGFSVMIRMPNHEVSADLADLNAVCHDLQMGR